MRGPIRLRHGAVDPDPGPRLVFVLAGFTKGVIGLGLPTISMGLLAVVLPPAEAAALLILPSLVTNVRQMVDGPASRPRCCAGSGR